MTGFLNGAISVAAAVVALQYLNAWKKTREPLFRLFSAAFFLVMFERIVIELMGSESNHLPFIYCIRLLAYLSIVVGVVRKNLQKA